MRISGAWRAGVSATRFNRDFDVFRQQGCLTGSQLLKAPVCLMFSPDLLPPSDRS
jgi:hypothetical protein